MKEPDIYEGYDPEARAVYEALDYAYDSIPYTPPAPPKPPLLRRLYLRWRRAWWSSVWSWHCEGNLHRREHYRLCDACQTYKAVIDNITQQLEKPDFPRARAR